MHAEWPRGASALVTGWRGLAGDWWQATTPLAALVGKCCRPPAACRLATTPAGNPHPHSSQGLIGRHLSLERSFPQAAGQGAVRALWRYQVTSCAVVPTFQDRAGGWVVRPVRERLPWAAAARAWEMRRRTNTFSLLFSAARRAQAAPSSQLPAPSSPSPGLGRLTSWFDLSPSPPACGAGTGRLASELLLLSALGISIRYLSGAPSSAQQHDAVRPKAPDSLPLLGNQPPTTAALPHPQHGTHPLPRTRSRSHSTVAHALALNWLRPG